MDWKRGVIERASMDGTARSILHSSNIIYPVSLALDRDTQKLYWIDSVLNRMESSFVDGSNHKILITSSSTLRRTHGMAVFQNLVYWTEQNRRKLHRISTSSPSGFISTLWTFPTTDKLYEITVVAPSDQPAGKYCVHILVSVSTICLSVCLIMPIFCYIYTDIYIHNSYKAKPLW